MILKIARDRADRDWWIIDGISRISVHKPRPVYTEGDYDGMEGYDFDMMITDNRLCQCEGPNEGCSNCPSDAYKANYKVLVMELRLDNGDISLILFDTQAYLLNNQGKTVEKYVVNFPAVKDDGSKR